MRFFPIVTLDPPAPLIAIRDALDHPEARTVGAIDNCNIADAGHFAIPDNGNPTKSAEGREH